MTNEILIKRLKRAVKLFNRLNDEIVAKGLDTTYTLDGDWLRQSRTFNIKELGIRAITKTKRLL